MYKKHSSIEYVNATTCKTYVPMFMAVLIKSEIWTPNAVTSSRKRRLHGKKYA